MAWAIFHGKNVENRTWNTYHRGLLLIHASKQFDSEHLEWLKRNQSKLSITLPDHFRHGVIIGIVTLTKVMRKTGGGSIMSGHGQSMGDTQCEVELLRKENSEYFSPWFFGPYGFVLKDAQEFKVSIPYRGSLGLFEVPDDIIPTKVRHC